MKIEGKSSQTQLFRSRFAILRQASTTRERIMKYFIGIILLTSSLIVACATHPLKNSGLKKLNSISGYKLSDFKLSQPIKFFKLRTYEYSDKGMVREFLDTSLWEVPAPAGGWGTTYDREIYKTLTNTEKKALNTLKPTIPATGEVIHYVFGGGTNDNIIADRPYPKADVIFYIASNGKAGMVNSKTGLKNFLGNIDTEAEIALLLWGYDSNYECYKKVINGYELYLSNRKAFMDLQGNIKKREKIKENTNRCH